MTISKFTNSYFCKAKKRGLQVIQWRHQFSHLFGVLILNLEYVL